MIPRRTWFRDAVRCTLGLAIALLGPGVARADEPAATADADEEVAEEKQRKLPFLGDKAREAGYELPLPFGGALVLTRLTGRKIEVTDTRLAIENRPGQSVSSFLDLGSTSDVFNANLKFDAWLLPFLNVYALAGYVHNESTTNAFVTLPRPGPIPGEETFETEIVTELDGLLGGVGITLAGGYKNFYCVGDVNYVQTDLGFDDAFTALIASIRAGFTGRVGKLPAQIWFGVGNWDTAATAAGHTVLDNGALLRFEADQQPKTYWMYDVGANLEFSRRFQLVVDLGHDFDGGWLFVLGPTYRF
jgi:hypothetical protein